MTDMTYYSGTMTTNTGVIQTSSAIEVSKKGLDKALELFNENKTRIRVSITSNCNLACTFCHKEGLNNYNGKKYMGLDDFVNIIGVYSGLGGREINITGGEPLMHPDVKLFINSLAAIPKIHTTLSTNGLRLDTVNLNPYSEPIAETKISFHTFNQSLAQNLLGKSYDVEKVKDSILNHLAKGYKTILNFTLTSQNCSELERLIEWVAEIGTHLKISDLGQTSRNLNFVQNNYLDTEFIDDIISRYAVDKKMLAGKRSGTHLQMYILPKGNHVLVKDRHNEQLRTGMCQKCSSVNYCSEGVFALRVNPDGVYQPCLVNTMFNTDPKDYSGIAMQDIMKIAIFKMITGFEGPVEI